MRRDGGDATDPAPPRDPDEAEVTGGTVLAGIAVALGVWLLWWLHSSRMRALRELARRREESALWGAPGEWRCRCGGCTLHVRSKVADGRGMLHGALRCEPDLGAL